MPSHQDKLRTGYASDNYKKNHDRIFGSKDKSTLNSDEWETVKVGSKTTYRKRTIK